MFPSEQMMRFAIEEAAKCRAIGESDSRVHPRVGAVLVTQQGVLYRSHRNSAGVHAEHAVIEVVAPPETTTDATLYTTLEPCTHRGPNEIPCVERIVQAGIARVFIGSIDPNPTIAGRGIIELRRAKIEVGLFSPEFMNHAERLNEHFFTDQVFGTKIAKAEYNIHGIWFGRVAQQRRYHFQEETTAVSQVAVAIDFRQTAVGVQGRSIVAALRDDGELDESAAPTGPGEEESSYGVFLSGRHCAVTFFSRRPPASYGTVMLTSLDDTRLAMVGYANHQRAERVDELIHMQGTLERCVDRKFSIDDLIAWARTTPQR